MADPGENFPMQFALGILQLAQQNKQKQAEISEMRAARAETNFLEKEKLANAQRMNFINQQFESEQAAAQEQMAKVRAETEKAAAEERIRFEGEKLRLERDQQVIQSLDQFGRTGSAFIPNYAAGNIPALMSSASSDFTIASIQIPGAGYLLQRINDPDTRMEYQETQAKIDGYRQKAALDYAKRQDMVIRQQQNADKVAMLNGRLDMMSVNRATDIQNQLRKEAAEVAIGLMRTDEVAARKAQADPRYAFPEGDKRRDLWDKSLLILTTWAHQQASGIQARTSPDVAALEAAGVDDVVFAASTSPVAAPSAAPAVKIVGRIKDESGAMFLIGEHGEKIPTTDGSTPVSMIGTASGSPSSPSTTITSSKRKATPADVAEAKRLAAAYRAATPNSPEALKLWADITKFQNEVEGF